MFGQSIRVGGKRFGLLRLDEVRKMEEFGIVSFSSFSLGVC